MRVFGLLIIALASSAFGNDCLKVKAAFDIGSGATKMKVARVDSCLQKIDKILMEEHRPVKYKESLQLNAKNFLDKKVIAQGVIALEELKTLARKFKPSSYEAVATSAFRTASNGLKAAEEISKKSGIHIKVISQEEEAKLGFVAASRLAKGELQNVLVWDIGGGSMQMSAYVGGGEFDIYQGKLAAVSFKKEVIQKAQGKDAKKVVSPNPIGKSLGPALEIAKNYAQKTVPDSLKNKIKGGAEVVGIGGVHYYSIKGQTGESVYTPEILGKTIVKNLNKDDSQLGGDYASTEVTNLILVQGFMKALGIKKVATGKINLADGILLGGVPR